MSYVPQSRREFLKTAGALTAAATLGAGSASAADPVLGMIFPPLNWPVPPEAKTLYPHGVEFLAKGVGLERMTEAGFDKVQDKILPAAIELKEKGATAISMMGTSLSFYKGAKFNQDMIDGISKSTGLKATTMSIGIVDGLKTAGARRVVAATAYIDDINNRLKRFLEEHGFEVVGVTGMGVESFGGRNPTQEELSTFSSGVWDASVKAGQRPDSLLISCGYLRTLELIVPMEARTKVPVVASTPHALRNGVKLVGLSGQAKGYGSVLAKA
jgi:arylmalonate decarboxylase